MDDFERQTPKAQRRGLPEEAGSWRGEAHAMAASGRVRVCEERETPRGWSYRVVVRGGATGGGETRETEHRVSLSWVDHNHYCGGVQAPSVTVERVIGALVEAVEAMAVGKRLPPGFGPALPTRFDLSLARRVVPGIDATLRRAG